MVDDKDIDDAKIPFDDEITQQSDFNETFLAALDADAKKRSKPKPPVNPSPWPDPSLHLTKTRSYNRTPDYGEIIFQDIHSVDRLMEEAADQMRRQVEDGKMSFQQLVPPDLQHTPQSPHYSKNKITRKKIKRQRKSHS